MYSMVLAMALSGGAATPADHCAGACHGYVGHGCHGGCWNGGCHGGGHRLFGGCHGLFGRFRGHGCDGGCWNGGCHGCHGGGHRLFGGLFGRHGCHGCNGGCHGGYACHGGYGCHNGGCHGGGAYPMPGPGTGQPAPEPVGKPKKTGEEASIRSATMVVSLPAEAKLTIDDNPTTSSSATRVFTTPELDEGVEYQYTLKAELTRNGQTLTEIKQVSVRAGQESRVILEFPAASVVRR
jgi:uncharacterized protein (TIGR03000 family)